MHTVQDLLSTTTEAAAKDASLKEYLSLLLPLCPLLSSMGKEDLRGFGTFSWVNAVSTPGSTQPGDVVFEACSCLLASSIFDMAKATAIVTPQGQTANASTDSVLQAGFPPNDEAVILIMQSLTSFRTQASKLLRSCSSSLAMLREHLLPLNNSKPLTDLEPELLAAMAQLATADAQMLALLRAIAKAHQPSLVAAIAVETGSMYASSFRHLSNNVAGRWIHRFRPLSFSADPRFPHALLPHPAHRASADAGGDESSGMDILADSLDPSSWQAQGLQREMGFYLRYK